VVKELPHKMAPEYEQMVENETEMAAKGIFKTVKDPQYTFSFLVAKGKGWRKKKKEPPWTSQG